MSFTSKLKSLLRRRSSIGFMAGLVLLLSAVALRNVGNGLSYHVSLVHGMMIIGGFALSFASILYPTFSGSAEQSEDGK